ncbi:MAG: hypothetical protein IK024_09790 [Treponema sp.]|nr:hypothetical protein [Treponema sp.]
MQKKPEIIVFAGPNGSGKTTVTKLAKRIEPYINADDIKNVLHCSDLEAAQRLMFIVKNSVLQMVVMMSRKIKLFPDTKKHWT